MTPTLAGRLQTRVFLLLTVGVVWTLALAPVLPGASDAPLPTRLRVTLTVLGFVLGLGVLWEFVYHGLQQYRWEKDWPTLFGLLTGVNEGVVAYVVVRAVTDGSFGVTGTSFMVHFVSTWLLVWAAVNGPLRIVALRWRFRGGRLI